MRVRHASPLLQSLCILLFLIACLLAAVSARASWTFSDQTTNAGFTYEHGFVDLGSGADVERRIISGGATAGDYDRDGWVDIYVVRGDIGPNLLFHNDGDGTFTEVGSTAGVAGAPTAGSGPIFVDLDGDRWLDLIVGGVVGSPPVVYLNQQDGTFQPVASSGGLDHGFSQFSASLADFDRDGDLDLATAHWAEAPSLMLWKNLGDGSFSDFTDQAGIDESSFFAFTPTFAELDGDGWPDLLVAGDFGTSFILMNDGDGTYTESIQAVITDENGMGAAVGDYDNDGDPDWFVSSIWDPNGVSEANWGVTGNRLYRNEGNGVFSDATDVTGVRQGYWGWGSCFADFDNDGHLDLFHVNGFTVPPLDMPPPPVSEYVEDPSRLFIADGQGGFTEDSAGWNLNDTGQGRGVLCLDYDRDGDLDLFVANNSQSPKLYRNDGSGSHWLHVTLKGLPPNTQGIGAKVSVTLGATTQVREVRAGNNFASAGPNTAHFGLGTATTIDEIRVDWPSGYTTVLTGEAADQYLEIVEAPPTLAASGGLRLAACLALLVCGAFYARRLL